MEERSTAGLIGNYETTRGQLVNHSSAASEPDVEHSYVSESETLQHLDAVDHGMSNHRANDSVEHNSHISPSTGSGINGEDIDLASTMSETSKDRMQPVDLCDAVSQGYPSLDFRFSTLKSWFLIVSAALWLSILVGVAALAMLQQSRPGVLHIRQTGNYLALRFTPGIIGTLTAILWKAIAQSYNRLFPYLRMANNPDLQRKEVVQNLLRNNIVDDTISLFTLRRLVRGRHWTLISVKFSAFSLNLLLVPFKSTLLQITEDKAGWGTTVSPWAAYIIIGLYAWLLLSTLAALVQLWNKPTGLKWNPCSVASRLALVHGSNIFEAFQGMEFPNCDDAQRIKCGWIKEYGCLRLGYWRYSQRTVESQKPEQLWYGIRFMKFDGMHSGTKQGVYGPEQAPIIVFPESKARRLTRRLRGYRFLGYPRYANGFANVFLNDVWISLCFLAELAALAGLAAGLSTGVLLSPITYAGTRLESSRARGMVLAFLPGFILSLGNLVFLNSDIYHRMLQPIRGMDKPHLAEHNVLIDYMSPNALSVIFDGLSRGHYRVAWGSFVAMNCTSAPVVAGKIFTVNEMSRTFQAAPFTAYSVLGILCLYLMALPLARVDPKYSASRGLLNIFDTVSLCYDSPMLEYPEFSVQKPDDEEVHLKSQVIIARRRYQFGYYLGLSGRRRLGFAEAGDVDAPRNGAGGDSGCEAVGQPDSAVQAVDRIKMRHRFFRFSLMNGGWWFWRPRIVGETLTQSRDTEMCFQTSDDEDGDGK